MALGAAWLGDAVAGEISQCFPAGRVQALEGSLLGMALLVGAAVNTQASQGTLTAAAEPGGICLKGAAGRQWETSAAAAAVSGVAAGAAAAA